MYVWCLCCNYIYECMVYFSFIFLRWVTSLTNCENGVAMVKRLTTIAGKRSNDGCFSGLASSVNILKMSH